MVPGVEWEDKKDPKCTGHSFHFDAFVTQSFSTKCWNCLPEHFDFSGSTYHRDSKQVPLDLACLYPKYAPLKPFWCIFLSQNQQNVPLLADILIFQELLIIDTWNVCHWIWHVSNPKYMPLKPLWCIFLSQNQQNVIFLPEILIFSGTTYNRYLKPVPLKLACLKL